MPPLDRPLSTQQALATLRQVSASLSAALLTPRKCVGCTDYLRDPAQCAACYARLYPREDPTGLQTP